jgi:2,4-didehydro-3-deoxy-L-rhamnonate hydrolase
MKLFRFGALGSERPGVLVDGERRDASALVADYDHAFFQRGGLAELRSAVQGGAAALPRVPDAERWGACVARPGKVVCVGLNFHDHAREFGVLPSAEPVLFMKAPNTVVGAYDDVLIPRGSTKTDWEVELGVVIGRDARYLSSPEQAREHVAGYCISHDVSEREFQLERGGQWVKGKSCDTFNPLGPLLVTPDEIADVQALSMSLDVNGLRRQSGNTREMIFGVAFLIHYISQFMTLEAGDVISTGTPAGVGLGLKPPVFLRPGDEVVLRVDGLGEQRQKLRSA